MGRVRVHRNRRGRIGMPVRRDGSYWMRAGEDLVANDSRDTAVDFRRIYSDFSADTCSGADSTASIPPP